MRPPTSLLKEQASALKAATKGVLYANVVVQRSAAGFYVELRIVAPALDDYEYSVLHVEHDLDMYPLKLYPEWAQRADYIRCENEEEFEAALAKVLSDARVKKVFASITPRTLAGPRSPMLNSTHGGDGQRYLESLPHQRWRGSPPRVGFPAG